MSDAPSKRDAYGGVGVKFISRGVFIARCKIAPTISRNSQLATRNSQLATRNSQLATRNSQLATRNSNLYLSLKSLLMYVLFQECRDIKQTGCGRVLGCGLHVW